MVQLCQIQRPGAAGGILVFQLFLLLVYLCGGIMAGIFIGLAELFRPAADAYYSAAMGAGPGFLTIIFYILAGIMGLALFVLWAGCIVPNLSVGWRRFQDQNIPGWLVIIFFVLGFIPYLNFISCIVDIVFMVLWCYGAARHKWAQSIWPRSAGQWQRRRREWRHKQQLWQWRRRRRQ